MILDEFANIWDKADAAEKKSIRSMIEAWYEKPQRKIVRQQAGDVLSFLNEKTGMNFRHVDTNLNMIVQRLNSGITAEQLKAIIARQCRKWKGTEMEGNLRPATLFNRTKCEQYIGELGK